MWRFLKKLDIELLYDPTIPLLGIHTEETRIERDTCTPMFITALFIIARTWKQPRCPSADEWIRKLWYIYTMKYYSIVENFPKMGKEIVTQIQETQKVPNRINPRQNTPRHILIKLMKIKHKEQILKAAREKQ